MISVSASNWARYFVNGRSTWSRRAQVNRVPRGVLCAQRTANATVRGP
jgi:hypothetical protein